jgi:hypothetical protein
LTKGIFFAGLGVFSMFGECPEFDFQMCWWRFISFQEDGSDFFGRNTECVHRYYDAHANHFSSELKSLLAAHVELNRHGLSFLRTGSASARSSRPTAVERKAVSTLQNKKAEDLEPFDVAISFAVTEREHKAISGGY